jgi:ceroid-lipofuscinosis MFS transporter 7
VTREHLSQEKKTDWPSIAIAAIVNFFTAVQFSIYFSSLWPYLEQVDANASEQFFGYITAGYSVGQAVSSPLLGWWSNRLMGRARPPVLTGIFCMLIGNMGYAAISMLERNQRFLMLIARIVTGIGGGESNSNLIDKIIAIE